jgi:hypothetical protein
MGGGGGENRKRYSSSFGHRYKDSAGGASEVSTGSAERRERESDKGGVSFVLTGTLFGVFSCPVAHY